MLDLEILEPYWFGGIRYSSKFRCLFVYWLAETSLANILAARHFSIGIQWPIVQFHKGWINEEVLGGK